MHGLPATMWWTLKTMPSACFTDVLRWVKEELGLSYQLDNKSDDDLNRMYPTLVQRKSVLRPLLIQRNCEKGLAVPKVMSRVRGSV